MAHTGSNNGFQNAYRYDGWAWAFRPHRMRAFEKDGAAYLDTEKGPIILFARCVNCLGEEAAISFEFEVFDALRAVLDVVFRKNTGERGGICYTHEPNTSQTREMEVLGISKWGVRQSSNYLASAMWGEEFAYAEQLCDNMKGYSDDSC